MVRYSNSCVRDFEVVVDERRLHVLILGFAGCGELVGPKAYAELPGGPGGGVRRCTNHLNSYYRQANSVHQDMFIRWTYCSGGAALKHYHEAENSESQVT
jgi:hypothetical protein